MNPMVLVLQESPWRLIVVVIFLVFFACVGVAHVISPDRFINRSAVRKGGEMLTEWNRFNFRLAGVIFTGGALYLLYVLSRDYFAK
jgi:hypothetical protein